MTLSLYGIVVTRRTLWKQKWKVLGVFFSLYLSLFLVFILLNVLHTMPRRVHYVVQPEKFTTHPVLPTTRIPPALLGQNRSRLLDMHKRMQSHKTWREPFKLPDFNFSRNELRLQFKEIPFVDPKDPYVDNIGRFHCKYSNAEKNRTDIPEDLWCLPRPQYLPHYKNPCFKVDANKFFPYGGITCLPYFHILGADKCGTTDFHSRLTEHPRILLNNGGLGKETYFWCWLRYGLWMMSDDAHIRTFENYQGLFYKPSIRIITELRRSNQQFVTGDGTPMDLWDFRGWQLEPHNAGLKEPEVLTPHLMRHMYRDPKFFVIMRNPVERIYSDYIFLGYGWTPEKFAEDVPKAITLMKNCLKVNSTRSCFFSNEMYHNLPMRLHIGCYSIFLREWLSVFDKRHFFFVRTEDYHTNMGHVMEKAFEFLDVDALTKEELQIIKSAKLKHRTKQKEKIASMYPETRALLVEFYAPFNQDLAKLLGDDRYLWKDTNVQQKDSL